MRLFVAITLPEAAVEDLDAFLDVRREADSGLRWSPPELWHVTLAFCGEFPERRLDDLEYRLTRAASRRHVVDARLAGGGAFPHVGRARVLWTGFEADQVEVGRLAAGTRAAVSKAGGRVDGQKFRGHLTLARMSHPVEATRWVRLLDGYRGPRWNLGEIALVASYLGEGPRGRPRHETLASFPIGAGGGDR